MTDAVSQHMLSTVDVGEKIVLGLGVADVGAAMQKFGWVDYVMFMCMLLMCMGIGLYYGLLHTSNTAQDYLIGGRAMKVFPVAMSLIASWVSGISLLGIPTEIYVYGVQYLYITGGFIISAIIFSYVFLPVFHGLSLTSIYEYQELRFDKKVRLFGSILFTIGLISWLPLVIYVPALAFNQVTGVNVHLITPIVCIICIFYTSMGGIKAVVWTDVIQIIVMFGSIFLVIIKGTIDTGGFSTIIERNLESDRIEAPNLDLDLHSRHTLLALTIGGFIHTLNSSALNQNMTQRYLSLPSIKSARRSLWIFTFGTILIILLSGYAGLLLFATYHKCDPLTTMLAREKDQLLPLLVMEILGDFPGLPGIFVAGIFSAALSSLSTGLNAMAAVFLEDFYKPFAKNGVSEKTTYYIMKLTVIILGAICVALVFIVEKLGAVLQLTMSFGAISSGPSLGIFTMGVLLPWVNAKGALIGGISGLSFMSWLCIRAQSLIASGDLTFPEKPVTTEGCHYHFTPKHSVPLLNLHLDPLVNITNVTHTDEKFMIYRLSYLWYATMGAGITIIVGLLVSLISKPTDPRDLDPQLLAPCLRKWIKPREFPNEPGDGIIYAYGSKDLNTFDNSELHLEKIKRQDV
ncbi:sodium-coupled monocarboxylate transporter 1-like isoform X2 [Aethina tumida]|uniref:sodium-coupled monocarboxylate transporter 1-like isoform X2 n=1 Tax=Aethina tumida TaxID=116153 RepID=UPI002148DFF8|nr:sodium-coupled monocarboxylate transporter 1-like isoform X2 [Aethina tumida]